MCNTVFLIGFPAAVIQDKLRHTENVSKSQTVQIASLEERLQVCQVSNGALGVQ